MSSGGNTPPLRTTDLPPGLHPAPSISCSSSLRITAILQVGSGYTHLTDEKREAQEGHGASGWKNLDLNSNLPNSKAHFLPSALYCLKLTGIKASQKGKGLKGNKGQEWQSNYKIDWIQGSPRMLSGCSRIFTPAAVTNVICTPLPNAFTIVQCVGKNRDLESDQS